MPIAPAFRPLAVALLFLVCAGTRHAAGEPIAAEPHPSCAWCWSGAVDDEGCTVVLRWREAAKARIAFATAPDLSAPAYVSPLLDLGGSAPTRAAATGLRPDTRYHYGPVDAAGIPLGGRACGSVTTFPPAGRPADFSIAAGSCMGTVDSVAFQAAAALEPRLFLLTGDFHYGDDAGANTDPERYRLQYEERLVSRHLGAFLRRFPIAYVWDDHDCVGKPYGRQNFRTLVPHYPLALPGENAPVAQAFTIGRVRVLMPDLRSDRGAGIIGAGQMAWLKGEITRAAAAVPLVVLVSSVPWNGPDGGTKDRWEGFPAQRRELADHVKASGLRGICIVSGDAHMVAIDDGSNADYATGGGMPIPVLQAAALSRKGSYKGGPYSHGAHPGAPQFGLVEVRDDGTRIAVTLSGRSGTDATGRTVVKASRDGNGPITYTFTTR